MDNIVSMGESKKVEDNLKVEGGTKKRKSKSSFGLEYKIRQGMSRSLPP